MMIRGKTIEKKCRCGAIFHPRIADVNRGWGKFCSKSCKAQNQTNETGVSGPDYRAEGRTVKQMQNGKYSKSKFKGRTNAAPPWIRAGVSKETFLHFAEEYGGTPVFDSRGEYAGFIPTPFDNSMHQNSDQNDEG